MSPTATADPALIPDIEAFEERVTIHIHEGGVPTEEAKDLAARAQGFLNQSHTTGRGSGSMSRGRGWGKMRNA